MYDPNAQLSMPLNNQVSGNMNQMQINSNKVILFFITPKALPPEARRPQQYSFGDDFYNQLSFHASEMSFNPDQIKNHLQNEVFRGSINLVNPSQEAIPLKTDALSNYWTFIMIIDQIGTSSGLGSAIPSPTRTIYTGFCIGEPVNYATRHLHTKMPMNPECRLEVTNYMTIVNLQKMSQYGGYTNQVGTRQSVDLINPMSMQMISPPESRFNLDPENALACVNYYANGTGQNATFSIEEAALSTPGVDNTSVENKTMMPQIIRSNRHHGALLASEVIDASSAKQFNDNRFDTNSAVLASDIDNANEQFMTSLSNRTALIKGMTRNGIDVGKAISLNELVAKYTDGAIERIVVEVNRTSPWETINQLPNSLTNIWNNIISTTLPVLANENQISGISFAYDSYADNGTRFDKGQFHHSHVEFHTVFSPEEQRQRVKSIERDLKQCLFNPIVEQAGEFRVLIHYTSVGECTIHLEIYDLGSQNPTGFSEYCSKLGGLSSPLIGTAEQAQHNSQELSSLILRMGDNFSNTPRIITSPSQMAYPPPEGYTAVDNTPRSVGDRLINFGKNTMGESNGNSSSGLIRF
jgi:hypothetical protein